MSIQDLKHYGLFARTRKHKAWWMAKRVLFALSAMLFLCPVILRVGGSGSAAPEFTYTGTYALLDDGDGNWRIRFLTSGTLTLTGQSTTVDIFCVGGGGSGASGSSSGCASGAGGKTAIGTVTIVSGTEYSIVVGAGAIFPGQGGTSSALTISAAGGTSGSGTTGGSGGTGGVGTSSANVNGVSNGANGNSLGQGTTTREFHEATGVLYAGSGGACKTSATEAIGGEGGGGTGGKYGLISSMPGADNTGGGGGAQVLGAGTSGGKNGGSGIVIFRNHRVA